MNNFITKSVLQSILIAVALLFVTNVSAQDSGFATSSDLKLGYKDKVFTSTLGFDGGYKLKDMVYLGVGPMVGFSTGNSVSAFSAGGYGKLRFTVPLHSEIKPFIQGNCGYSYNFKSEDGGMIYGAAIGLKFKKVAVGVFCDIASNTTTITKSGSYWQQHSHRRDLTGKRNSTPSGKWVSYSTSESDTEWIITPCFLIGIEF